MDDRQRLTTPEARSGPSYQPRAVPGIVTGEKVLQPLHQVVPEGTTPPTPTVPVTEPTPSMPAADPIPALAPLAPQPPYVPPTPRPPRPEPSTIYPQSSEHASPTPQDFDQDWNDRRIIDKPSFTRGMRSGQHIFYISGLFYALLVFVWNLATNNHKVASWLLANNNARRIGLIAAYWVLTSLVFVYIARTVLRDDKRRYPLWLAIAATPINIMLLQVISSQVAHLILRLFLHDHSYITANLWTLNLLTYVCIALGMWVVYRLVYGIGVVLFAKLPSAVLAALVSVALASLAVGYIVWAGVA